MDVYLDSLYKTLEMCDLVLTNSETFTREDIKNARKLRIETQERIQLYKNNNR